jgi:hypothetical protein
MLRPRFAPKCGPCSIPRGAPADAFGFCGTLNGWPVYCPFCLTCTGRWAEEGKPGVFGWDLKREFYNRLSAQLLERGWLRFSWLEWSRRVLACQYRFVHEGSIFSCRRATSRFRACNAGIGLRAWSIREFVKQGIREYDFMAGWDGTRVTGSRRQAEQTAATGCQSQNSPRLRGEGWEESTKRIIGSNPGEGAHPPPRSLTRTEAGCRVSTGAHGWKWLRFYRRGLGAAWTGELLFTLWPAVSRASIARALPAFHFTQWPGTRNLLGPENGAFGAHPLLPQSQ